MPAERTLTMRRVLIVSPHFPPVNAPDMQRVRLALPHLRQHGWEPVVLALDPSMVEGAVLDPLLEATYPADIEIVRVHGLPARATRWAGIGNLWWRTGGALTRAGDRLLSRGNFDLVFISTTQFSAFSLGPRWKRKFGVPFVLDYQDPWTTAYYGRAGIRPPGGRVKYALSRWTARRLEPRALREAAGIIAVSEAYGRGLAATYPWFDAARVQLLPFGAAPQDFIVAARHRPAAPVVDFDDGLFHLVLVGRCDPGTGLTALLRAFRRHLAVAPQEARRMRFHFIGTDYAPPPLGVERVMPVARAEGVDPYVSEHRYRVPYFDALYYLQHADVILGIGTNDPSYAASKIFPSILARRPLLLIYHRGSLVLKLARAVGAGAQFGFDAESPVDALADELHARWFAEPPTRPGAGFNETAFEPYTASVLSRQLCTLFDLIADIRAVPDCDA